MATCKTDLHPTVPTIQFSCAGTAWQFHKVSQLRTGFLPLEKYSFSPIFYYLSGEIPLKKNLSTGQMKSG